MKKRLNIYKLFRKINKWIIGIVLVLLFVASLLIISIPFLLNKIDELEKCIRDYMSGLLITDYKVAYVGLLGGILGSMLGVLGAVYVQDREQKNEHDIYIRRCARITYYDITLFYHDFSPAVVPFFNNNKNDDISFKRLKDSTKVLLNPEWIKTIADLGEILDMDMINKLYVFYGNLLMLEGVLQSQSNVEYMKSRAKEILRNVGYIEGKEYVWYKKTEDTNENGKLVMGEILEILQKKMKE